MSRFTYQLNRAEGAFHRFVRFVAISLAVLVYAYSGYVLAFGLPVSSVYTLSCLIAILLSAGVGFLLLSKNLSALMKWGSFFGGILNLGSLVLLDCVLYCCARSSMYALTGHFGALLLYLYSTKVFPIVESLDKSRIAWKEAKAPAQPKDSESLATHDGTSTGSGVPSFSETKERPMIWQEQTDKGFKKLIGSFDPDSFMAALSSKVRGQDAALSEVLQALDINIRKRRFRIEESRKPLGVFLAVGPTGVGKTQTAKALAEVFQEMDETYSLLSFAMGEFRTQESVVRLTGSPPGYVGSEMGGQLTFPLMRNRNRIILFDEVEKAHPSILPIFLNIFDEGFLTEASNGFKADFSRSIILLTSNLASEEIGNILDKQPPSSSRTDLKVKNLLRSKGLAPELLARIDRILPYKKLDADTLVMIVGDILFKYGLDRSRALPLVRKYEPFAAYGVREIVRRVEQDIMGYGSDEQGDALPPAVERITQDGLFSFLRSRVIGQDTALEKIANMLAVQSRKKTDSPSHKPIGVFLAVGPTGVGKTETAKAIAEYMKTLDPGYDFLTFDMSEFYDRHTASRLVGSPPGYVGSDQPGQLTGPVSANPLRVILFDEIEKADPSVMNVFLQIFDEGRLTDASNGSQARFDKCVIVLTSNLDAEKIGRVVSVKKEATDIRRIVLDILKGEGLRPELLARIHEVVPYRPLDVEDYVMIVQAWLDRLPENRRPKDTAGMAIGIVEEAKDLMSYGVREILRAAEKKVYQASPRTM